MADPLAVPSEWAQETFALLSPRLARCGRVDSMARVMGQTPRERLERLRRHCVQGFSRVRFSADERALVANWLDEHPSREPAVDALWREAVEGRGELAEWLAGSADLDGWPLAVPAHTVLASHPFAALPPWSLPSSSRAS